VITGASAGVGRAVAQVLARRGWRLALLARDEAALGAACTEAETLGATRAIALSVDMADAAAVLAAAERAAAELGGIDLWVNNAMATMLAPVAETTPEEFRRVTEVTYLGAVHGTMAALRHMRPRNAGTILQVGSALAYRAIPLQAAYCGAKFALRGFTDALRCELLHEGSRVRLTMVQLPAVDTPQFDWARNRMPRRPQPVPPIYRPETAATAICRAAETAPRELWVGGSTVQAILGAMLAPGVMDRLLARRAHGGQMTREPASAARPDNLFAPVAGLHALRGRFGRQARDHASAFDPRLLRGIAALGGLLALPLAVAIGRGLMRRGDGASRMTR
jgi:NAD(P)-dependent dehydrogenase (short-subunit alcohol dehydrogenase family)